MTIIQNILWQKTIIHVIQKFNKQRKTKIIKVGWWWPPPNFCVGTFNINRCFHPPFKAFATISKLWIKVFHPAPVGTVIIYPPGKGEGWGMGYGG